MLKDLIPNVPVIGPALTRLYRSLRFGRRQMPPEPFLSSSDYWKRRYETGRNSGDGSYGKFAEFKAEILNKFVKDETITSVIEFGCGDGNQLRLLAIPSYIGFDVSETAVALCNKLFSRDRSKQFRRSADYRGEQADLTLSLDVIYHLVEDDVFHSYMRTLFGAAKRYVIIYSSDMDHNDGFEPHIRHRRFTEWIGANVHEWELQTRISNRYPFLGNSAEGSFADFFIYGRKRAEQGG
jgi:SAM-dependent methyltransferase